MPFLGPSTKSFMSRISKLENKISLGTFKIKTFCKRNKTLLSLFSKDYKCYQKSESPCVYRVKCRDCCESYIGETGRTVRIRAKEHSRLKEYSAVTDHLRKTGHSIDFDNPIVLMVESSERRRKILESFLLRRYLHFENNVAKSLVAFL